MQNKTSRNAKIEAPREGIFCWDELLSLLGEILKKQHAKAMRDRIRNPKTFRLHLDAGRVFAYIAGVYGGILKDKDLTDI